MQGPSGERAERTAMFKTYTCTGKGLWETVPSLSFKGQNFVSIFVNKKWTREF